MKIIADLHIHSHFSRATSPEMNIESLSEYAKVKGLDLLGTGDFTHPKWLEELREKLVPSGDDEKNGVFTYNEMNFILQAEISLIYTQGGRGRRVHLVVLAPNFEVVDSVNEWLDTKGRRDYDGRPIFSFSCSEFTEKMMSIDKDILIVPAHAWTPWFALFGSMSGFNSLRDCFQDQTKNIHAIETGLSSDPAMNWRLPELDSVVLLSNSDSHSVWPWRLGREANVFELREPSYYEMLNAIKQHDKKRFLYTLETDPSYGKYHYDGHRLCNVSMSPEQAKKLNNICPKCGKQLTIGVMHRVEELATRPEGFVPDGAIPFKSILPLHELLSSMTGSGLATRKLQLMADELIMKHGSELGVLLDAPTEEIARTESLGEHGEKLASLIATMRQNKLKFEPGYDGVYGRLIIDKMAGKAGRGQKSLSDY